MKNGLLVFLCIVTIIGCKPSAKERLKNITALRDEKQAALTKLGDSLKLVVTPATIQQVSNQMEPLRETVDSLDHIIDSLEGREKPHRRWNSNLYDDSLEEKKPLPKRQNFDVEDTL